MAASLTTVFSALADPTRRRILTMLLEDDMAVTDVADPFEMSLAAISKHLTILAAAGLITQEKRGRVKWCKLDPDALRAASTWMQGFGQFEPLNLERLEQLLDGAGLNAPRPASSHDAGQPQDHQNDHDQADDIQDIAHALAPSEQVDDSDDHDHKADND